MSFSADWLKLREPHDARARNPVVLDAVADSLAGKGAIRIVDLACGTGSTLRAVAPRIPATQNWQLVDNNLSLLARASDMVPPTGVRFSTAPIDINYDLEAALDGPIDLVTTSALLDLASADWLQRLVVEIVARSIPIYAALTYDGRAEISPKNSYDDAILAAVNAHQRRDKGFGPALGPTAAVLPPRDLKRSAIASCKAQPTGSSPQATVKFRPRFLPAGRAPRAKWALCRLLISSPG
jgi:SAM-dependent methyltransferase